MILSKNGIRLESWQSWGLIVFLVLSVIFIVVVLVLEYQDRNNGR